MQELLDKHNFQFSKKFGQNFISDKNFLASIVNIADINEEDDVLEIGAGAGTLTKEIAKKANKVVSYEIDKTLTEILAENLSQENNVLVHFEDALKTDIKQIEKDFDGKYKIVANLPYYITTPLLFKFLEETDKVLSITVMVQKEVAQRMVAKPNSKDYGALTIAMEYFGDAKIAKNVSRKMFKPVPNVDSAIVKIDIVQNKYDCNQQKFSTIVKTSFSKRRKTLVNNLYELLKMDKSTLEIELQKLGIDKNVRAEQLSVSDFVLITKTLFK